MRKKEEVEQEDEKGGRKMLVQLHGEQIQYQKSKTSSYYF